MKKSKHTPGPWVAARRLAYRDHGGNSRQFSAKRVENAIAAIQKAEGK